MTTAYTSLLGLALPVTGELSGTWGDTVNNSITSLLDSAVAGTTTLSTDADVTLTTTTGAANTAREAILLWTAGGTVTRTITAPAQSKIYTVINASSSTQSIKLVGAGPTTGVTILKGESALCAWNGSDFIKISNTAGAGVFSSITNTGLTSGRVVYSTTGGLETDSANLTFNGTTLTANTLNLTNALGTAYGGTGLTSFTANGVVYASSTSALTTGSALTFDGTNFGVGNSSISDYSGTVLAIHAASGSAARIKLTNSVSGTGQTQGAGITYDTSYLLNLLVRDASGAIVFSPASGVEGMRLTSTGLGIGTSSPSTKLSVTGDSSNLYTGLLYLNDSTASAVGVGGRIGFAGVTGALATVAGLKENATGGDYAGFLQFATRPSGGAMTERMRLDSSGNLGLGVTPSAWSTVVPALQLGTGGTFLAGWGSTSYLALGANASFNGSNWIYKTSNASSYYDQSVGSHRWYNAASGTAGGIITFTQAMTLDASGNLGIGTTSPSYKLHVQGYVYANSGFTLLSQASGGGSIYEASGNTGIAIGDSANVLRFTTSSSERARIDSSGNLLVNTTSITDKNGQYFAYSPGDETATIAHTNGTGSGIPYLRFLYNASVIGSITQSGTTGVLYNITSDYRLKNLIGNISGQGARIDALEPIEYEWKSDGSRTRGFLAHKFQEVYPNSVAGEKDAVDAEGKPVYQTMQASTSEVIADLVAEIQSLRKRLAALEAK